MPRRRWRRRRERERLPDVFIAFMLTGAFQYTPRASLNLAYFRSTPLFAAAWQTHGAELTRDWVCRIPGTRPWAWWYFDAQAPRAVVRGPELVLRAVEPGGWDWVWRQQHGVPAMVQARPPGYIGPPTVESQAAYLDRHGLLSVGERAALPNDAFAPEIVDPFILDSTRGASTTA